jgi:hypothetical protein
MLSFPVFAKLQPRSVPPAAPRASTRTAGQFVCKLVTLRAPTDTCIPFLFNRSSTLRLRRRPTGSCVSPLFPCLCGRFPSQQGGTPLPQSYFPLPLAPSLWGACRRVSTRLGENPAFHQSRVTSQSAEAGEPRARRRVAAFLSPVPLRPRRHDARMLWDVVVTPHWETSPLLPVSKSMSRADAGCGNLILPIPGQVSCRKAGWLGKPPQGCGSLRAGKAGSVRLGQHALLEP